ncbi:MAG TPA: response regulator [Opitutaceae bacterium]|nr:response regulator [Opitutaceae bacterium]
MTEDDTRAALLLVEDDDDDVFLFEHALARAGFRNPVQVVPDSLRAVAYLAGHDAYADRIRHPLPAVVVVDLRLPGEDGIGLLRWIRANPALRRLAVVVFTTCNSTADLQSAWNLAVNSYLLKPSDPKSFAATVKALAVYWLRLNLPAP